MADFNTNLAIKLMGTDNASGVLGGAAKKIQDNFGKIQLAAAAAAAAITAYAGIALDSFASTGEAISNMSASTGIATESLSALKLAGDQTSIPLETITGAVKKMQVNMESMNLAGADSQKTITNLGLNFQDLVKKTPEQQLFAIGNAIASIKDPAERTTAAISVFGKSGTDLIPLFQQGSMSMDDWKKKADSLGLTFDQLAIDKAGALDQAMDDLHSGFQGISQTIAEALSPQITQLMTAFDNVLPSVIAWIKENPTLTTGIFAAAAAMGALIAIAPGLAAAIALVGGAFTLLAANPIVLVIAAIVLFIGAIAACIYYNDALRAKIIEIWNAIVAFFTGMLGGLVNYIIFQFTFWKDTVLGILGLFQAAWGFFWDTLKATVTGILDAIVLVWNLQWAVLTGVVDTFKAVLLGDVNALPGPVKAAFELMKAGVDLVLQGLQSVWNTVWAAMTSPVQTVIDLVNSIASVVSGAISAISNLATWASTKLGGGSKGSIPGASIGGHHARGGSVDPNTVNVVGEEGPEYFVPDSRGMIIPTSKTNGSNISIVVTGNTLLDDNAANEIGDMIFNRLRLNNHIA